MSDENPKPLTVRVDLHYEGFTVSIDSCGGDPFVEITPHTSQSYPEQVSMSPDMLRAISQIIELVL